MSHSSVAFLLALLLPLLPLPAPAQDCGEAALVNPTKATTTTKLALDAIHRFVGSASVNADFVRERDSIFTHFPDGEQALMNYLFYHDACLLIKASDLPPLQKLDRLMELRERLFMPVKAGNVVATTRRRRSSLWHSPTRNVGLARRPATTGLSMRWRFMRVDESQPVVPPPPPPGKEEDEFLREAPYVVTRANKYFVIVGSAPTREAGIAEMERLKKRAPRYDFVLYEPYGDNTSYGIMTATWVPLDVARRALAVARRDVNPHSYLWACRHEGREC